MKILKRDSSPGAPHTELVRRVADARDRLVSEVDRRIVGQREVLEHMLIALFAGGHVLLVGVPGLAKTLLVKTLCSSLGLEFGRIQFTPDLMPSDITGTDILDDVPGASRTFRFARGPIFRNLLLADEVNRTPPKTQAALLEGMQERSVTVGGHSYPLERPFVVFATQNPIEQSGTYPLPEAQLDRFMLQVNVGYPSASEEIEIVKRSTVGELPPVTPMLNREQIISLQDTVPLVPVADHVVEYAVRLVRRSRPSETSAPDEVRRYVVWGAGPRAAQMLVLAAKARALLRGRYAVDDEDVAALLPSVLRHRLVTSFEAEAEGIRPDDLIARILATTQK
ncbi:MAG: MoxR family ATPase [Myxococcota bacterium]|jgi:MoxR-like ATPase|nr:MoxR family ATPase [Myxococcota bacterium]